MAAVIRLKRRVDEDPLNAFVLNCKRQRVCSESSQQPDPSTTNGNDCPSAETSTVLKFAGTFENAENIPAHLQQRLTKEEAKDVISRVHRPNIASRNRSAHRQTAQNNRFRVVNCTRSFSYDEAAEGTTIVDVERDVAAVPTSSKSDDPPCSSSSTAAAAVQEQNYVYDLYVADESAHTTHIPYIPDNLDDIRLVLVEDLYYTFFSLI